MLFLLCVKCFFVFLNPYPNLNLNNHLLQQGFHLFAGLCIDGVDFALAPGVGGGAVAFIQVVVDLVDPTGAKLAEFAFWD